MKSTSTLSFSKDSCLNHYKWGNNCDGWVFVDREDLSVKQELMPAGTSERVHYHERACQFFFVLQGTATFTINGESGLVQANEGVEVLPGQTHCIANNADGKLEFIVYSQPSTTNDRVNV